MDVRRFCRFTLVFVNVASTSAIITFERWLEIAQLKFAAVIASPLCAGKQRFRGQKVLSDTVFGVSRLTGWRFKILVVQLSACVQK